MLLKELDRYIIFSKLYLLKIKVNVQNVTIYLFLK